MPKRDYSNYISSHADPFLQDTMPTLSTQSQGGATPTAASMAERPSTAWTSEDDNALMLARAQNLNWQAVASKWFPLKTPNACRKRHERLQQKRNAENLDGVKMEDLARAYLECREEMWQILASKMQEKWTTVETKVSFT